MVASYSDGILSFATVSRLHEAANEPDSYFRCSPKLTAPLISAQTVGSLMSATFRSPAHDSSRQDAKALKVRSRAAMHNSAAEQAAVFLHRAGYAC